MNSMRRRTGLSPPIDCSRKDSQSTAPRAISVVELLVALSIISLLLALVSPAIQRSRSSARTLQCVDRLRQLGLATHNHISAHQELPATATRFRDRRGKIHSSISPHARLLPYLEQDSLYETINWNHVGIDNPGEWPDSRTAAPGGRRTNETALSTTVALFLCPSDVGRRGGNNYRACMGYGPGIFGPGSRAICQFPGNASGAFVNGRATRPSEFRDGMSHTVLFSEQLIGDLDGNQYTPWTDTLYVSGKLCTAREATIQCRRFAVAGAEHDSFRGTTWLFGGWRQTWYNHVLTPNSHVPDCSAGGEGMVGGGNGAYAARSYHDGGVNVVMADASARFVSENINPAIWKALSTRDGGEGIDQF